MGKGFKLTYLEVQERFAELGYKLISTEYVNATTKLKYVCSKHPRTVRETSVQQLKKGIRCRECSIEKRKNPRHRTIQEVQKLFSQRGLILISKNYEKTTDKLKFKCPVHNEKIQEISLASFLLGVGCWKCTKKTHTTEEAQEIFKNRNASLLTSPYKDSRQELEYICQKHSEIIQKVSLSNFMLMSHTCKYCAREAQIERQLDKGWGRLLEKCESFNYKMITKREFYKGKESNIEYSCSSHGEQIVKARELLSGCGCPACKESKGERRIREILLNNQIEFIPQMTFSDLSLMRKLSYDFYIPLENILIEYQGEFHDGSVNKLHPKMQTSEMLELQLTRDNLKREYAKDNNMRLLEIWYWDFDNIEEILSKEGAI